MRHALVEIFRGQRRQRGFLPGAGAPWQRRGQDQGRRAGELRARHHREDGAIGADDHGWRRPPRSACRCPAHPRGRGCQDGQGGKDRSHGQSFTMASIAAFARACASGDSDLKSAASWMADVSDATAIRLASRKPWPIAPQSRIRPAMPKIRCQSLPPAFLRTHSRGGFRHTGSKHEAVHGPGSWLLIIIRRRITPRPARPVSICRLLRGRSGERAVCGLL